MFTELQQLLKDKLGPKRPPTYTQAYADIFLGLVASQQQQMSGLLSVNCVFVTALHRVYGAGFFAVIVQRLWDTFSLAHS
jgi:hypothetical protein